MTNTKRATATILAIALVGDTGTLFAQSAAPQAPAASPASAPIAAPISVSDANTVRLLVGRSAIVDVGSQIARVSLTSSDIADAMVTTPNQLLVNGKLPGTISMFVWDKGGTLRRYEVSVGRDLNQLGEQVRQLFPGERIEVQNTGKNIVLSGTVSSKEMAEKAVSVAAGYVEKKDDVVSLLQIGQAPATKQVMLRVRFAEVNRTALTELGLALAANGAKDGRWFGRSTTQQFAAPEWDEQGRFVFSDFLNLFLFDAKNQVAGAIKALQNKGLYQSLAEPNLVAESGKEASFLAGGEIPVPVVQGTGGNMAVSILWKEFGVRLNFTPQVNGDRVHLKVKPEVSTLDFTNAITLQGFRIPSLTTRRTETELELADGQTFAIAGLMNNSVSSSMQKIPGIGDIPILGNLFRSKAARKEQTELVVMITPEILRGNSPGVTPNLPRTPERFLDRVADKKTQEMPAPAFGGRSSSASAAPAVETIAPTAPSRTANAAAPEAAAATLSSLMPAGPKVVAPASAQPAAGAPAPAAAVPASSPVSAVSAMPAAPSPAKAPKTPSVAASRPSAPVTPAPVASAPAAPMAAPVPAAAPPAPPVPVAAVPVSAMPVVPAPAPSPVTAAPAAPVATADVLSPEEQKAVEDFLAKKAAEPVQTASVSPARPKPATKEETELLERALREQHAREEAMKKAEAAEAKHQAKLGTAAQKQAKKDQAEAKKQAELQSKKDAEAAQKQADADRKRAESDAKRDAENAKKQAESAKKQAAHDADRNKSIDEAAARLRAAQEAYQAELAKQGVGVVASSR